MAFSSRLLWNKLDLSHHSKLLFSSVIKFFDDGILKFKRPYHLFGDHAICDDTPQHTLLPHYNPPHNTTQSTQIHTTPHQLPHSTAFPIPAHSTADCANSPFSLPLIKAGPMMVNTLALLAGRQYTDTGLAATVGRIP